MRTYLISWGFLLFSGIFVSGGHAQEMCKTENITPAEACTLLNTQASNTDFVVLDVRTPQEYSEGHLPGATLLDYKSPQFEQELAKLDRNKTYLVYCRAGNRSAKAVEKMQEFGFKHIVHMQTGIEGWNKK